MNNQNGVYVMENILTETRKKIISMLQKDGRLSLTEIAARLGISHTGVKKHLRKLIGEDIISIKAFLNPKKLGLRLAFILIETESYDDARELLSKFRECPRIVLLASLVGGYNIVALAAAEDMSVLESITSVCALRTSKGIRRSEVLLVSELAYPEYIPLRISLNKDKTHGVLPCGFDCCKCPRYLEKKCTGCPLSNCYRGSL